MYVYIYIYIYICIQHAPRSLELQGLGPTSQTELSNLLRQVARECSLSPEGGRKRGHPIMKSLKDHFYVTEGSLHSK